MTKNLNKFLARQKKIFLNEIASTWLKIAYTDVGEGRPIILLHGIPTWSYLYHEVIPLLESHGRILAPDFLGHGYSDKRDIFDRSLRSQTKMILEFMNKLEIEKATIVGHDTGGGVALILAIEHPEKIDQLVLSNIVAYDSWPIDDMLSLGNPSWKAKPTAEVIGFLEAGLPDGIYNKDRLTSEFKQNIFAPYNSEEGKVSLIRNASSLNTNHTTMLANHHSEISSHTLILWGVHDPWQTIADGEKLAQEIPSATLVRLEKASHWLQQDSPKEFADEIIKFLA
ncbi:MAG: Haloalkane dehalogenase 2 [Alphaproteobacteria bacterium MarineAlpha3_Bin5]|nr:oxidoreductase [Magnetovibrio sp.]PPR79122.1 MAG: Haloalkane dehalogenase 2 [Alphaproteobacteria bacterium MarineAlpha3_Bin5]|tara:strand:+ start:290 stop:1138 length:849 start_codon:yes stop_codon:yes gene_type:complete